MRRVIAPVVVLVGSIVISGCGPMMVPAFQRLEPDQQAIINGMWKNMLTPVNRLDRELLLDVMLAYELHQLGADRARYHVEKDYADGVVCMDVNFDRTKPRDDELLIEIKDRANKSLRSERYTGPEVWSHWKTLTRIEADQMRTSGWMKKSMNAPTSQPSEEDAAAAAYRDARKRQIEAATQPTTK